jgi:hypothetical protein
MNGQLWEECFCGTEPVCASCEKCKKHCTCEKPVQPKMTAQDFIDTLRQEGFDDASIRAAACDGETLARYGVTDEETAEEIVRVLDVAYIRAFRCVLLEQAS